MRWIDFSTMFALFFLVLVVVVGLSLATYIICSSWTAALIAFVALAIIVGVCVTVVKLFNKRKKDGDN